MFCAAKLGWEQIFFRNYVKAVQHITDDGLALGRFYVLVQEWCFNIFIHGEFINEVVGLKHKTNVFLVQLGAVFFLQVVDGLPQEMIIPFGGLV